MANPASPAALKAPSERISLVVSDVDGTLIATDKSLPAATLAAAAKLRAAGVELALVSSRPPRGMVPLVEALDVPVFGGFNGSAILKRDLTLLEQTLLPEAAARATVGHLAARGLEIWVFSGTEWFITDPDGEYRPLEEHTVRFPPTVVAEFGAQMGTTAKIVGASSNFALIAEVEAELQALLRASASAHRSQNYYVDITPPATDKGHAVRRIASLLGRPLEEVATIGDMGNDVPMFGVGGLAIAMGNASDAVKAAAHVVTGHNDANGFAEAMERFVLPRAPARA